VAAATKAAETRNSSGICRKTIPFFPDFLLLSEDLAEALGKAAVWHNVQRAFGFYVCR
jgi:hypothetical protein